MLSNKEVLSLIEDHFTSKYDVYINMYSHSSKLGSVDKAEDLLQDAYLKAVKSVQTYNGKARVSTWFNKIIYNLYYDMKKQLKKADKFVSYEESEEFEEDLAFFPDFDERPVTEMMNKIFTKGNFSEEQQKVLMCKYVHGTPTQTILDSFGLSTQNLKYIVGKFKSVGKEVL